MQLNGIDEKDNQIIALLIKDARSTYSDIGKQVGLTRVAVKNRVKVLEERGIIRGYHAEIDPLVAPEMMAFVIYLETRPEAYETIAEGLKAKKCVVTLCQTSGDSCLHGICVVENVQAMRAFTRQVRNEYTGLRHFAAYAVLDVMKGSLLSDG